MNEPKWMHHCVTMPDDKALEYLDDLKKAVNKAYADPGYAISLSMAIDKMRAPLPDNKAMTIDELREMDGEPVWCLEFECWALVWLYVDTPFLRFNDGSQASSHPALSYTIYRRPPEKGE